MQLTAGIIDEIFDLSAEDDAGFESLWQVIAAYQVQNCDVYARYCKLLDVQSYPFLPIEAFKYQPLTTFPSDEAAAVFKSSGTGSGARSTHYIKDLRVYEQSIYKAFSALFGKGPYTLLAYLPHYQQMGQVSSLLYMINHLLEAHGDEISGFYFGREKELRDVITSLPTESKPIVFGAAFGLLDLIEQHVISLPRNAIVVETGGMKTYRKEVTRTELQRQLAAGLGVSEQQVWSEYGMCELLSQAYATGGSVFYPPPWMRFKIMDPEMPLEEVEAGRPGALAIIDLANVHTVSSILTQDKAIKRGKGFEVLGRLSGAELRGCNFLLEKT